MPSPPPNSLKIRKFYNIGFLFYANFPADTVFMMEVIQRFALLSYIPLIVFFAFGLIALKAILNKLLSLFMSNRSLLSVTCYLLLVTLTLSYLLFAIFANWPKTDLSKANFGSNLAFDVFATTGAKSIVVLEDDTAHFASAAFETIKRVEPGTHLVVINKLTYPFYVQNLKKSDPGLKFPSAEDYASMSKEFFKANQKDYEIYSLAGGFDLGDGTWIPVGLLTKYYPKGVEVSDQEFDRLQEEFWPKYKNNLELFSKTHGNLTFEHIRGLYAFAHASVAQEYLKRGNFPKAILHSKEAVNTDSSLAFVHDVLGQVLLKNGSCNESISEFAKSYEINKAYTDSFLNREKVARECLKDNNLADQYLEQYNQLTQQSQEPL